MARMLQETVFVAGHKGMVGSAICRHLQQLGYCDIITASRVKLELTDQAAVHHFFQQRQIRQVYLCAAKVGGIHANNTYPADFIYENLIIESNIIQAAHRHNVQKLLFLGSSCIYPKHAPQPMSENTLLTGPLEPTNEPYAIAKIAGIKLCESFNRQYGRDYRSVMPTNLYGPNDNFHPDNSHVIPALIQRIHKAKQDNDKAVTIWGSGTPRREFLHVDDMATASIHVMELEPELWNMHSQPQLSHINIGSGVDHTIRETAELISKVVGFKGELRFDTSKPDGAPRKLLDVARINHLGWRASIPLEAGLQDTYQRYLQASAKEND